MHLIRDTASMLEAIELPCDPRLRDIIRLRTTQLGGDPVGLAHLIVVEPHDPITTIDAELGFPVLENYVDGVRYGAPEFAPSWEWIKRHDGWFEFVFILTDDGFGHVVFVQDHEGVDPELLALCREYT